MQCMLTEGHTSTPHTGMWSRTTSMDMDDTACGTHAKDRTTMGHGGMDLATTIQILAPTAPPLCVMGTGALRGVQNATGEKPDTTRLSRFSPAIQLEAAPERNRATLVGNYLCTIDMQI
jgi:hypothetical protein